MRTKISTISLWSNPDGFIAASVWCQDRNTSNVHHYENYFPSAIVCGILAEVVWDLVDEGKAVVKPWVTGGSVGWTAEIKGARR